MGARECADNRIRERDIKDVLRIDEEGGCSSARGKRMCITDLKRKN